MSLEQDVGKLQGQVEELSNSCARLEVSLMKAMSKIDALNTTIVDLLAQGKGGLKVTAFLISICSAVSGGVAWLVTHVKF